MRTRLVSSLCCLVPLPFTGSLPSQAQQDTTADSQNIGIIVATVVSSSRDTLAVRGTTVNVTCSPPEAGTRPAGSIRGVQVRVTAGCCG